MKIIILVFPMILKSLIRLGHCAMFVVVLHKDGFALKQKKHRCNV
jgi:hypothetical protein